MSCDNTRCNDDFAMQSALGSGETLKLCSCTRLKRREKSLVSLICNIQVCMGERLLELGLLYLQLPATVMTKTLEKSHPGWSACFDAGHAFCRLQHQVL